MRAATRWPAMNSSATVMLEAREVSFIMPMRELERAGTAVRRACGSTLYLAEEMKSTYEYRRLIKANDRATLLNLMIGLNAYTLCSGIICEDLNGNDYKAVPLKETEKMRIGYIKRKGAKVSHIGELYIEELKKYKEKVM